MRPTHINSLSLHSNEKVSPSIKNGRRYLWWLWGRTSDTNRQKLLKCILTGNSKLYLSKVYTEEQLKQLSEERVEKLFNNYEAKLSGQMDFSLWGNRSLICIRWELVQC